MKPLPASFVIYFLISPERFKNWRNYHILGGNMERKRFYRLLLPVVIVLAFLYILGLVGVVPFTVSYYITIVFIILFLFLRWEARFGRN